MQITFNNEKYRYKYNQWQFLGHYLDDHWFTVINKDRIKELNNFVRQQKLERICE